MRGATVLNTSRQTAIAVYQIAFERIASLLAGPATVNGGECGSSRAASR
jgi:hypothetical protein